MDTYVAIYLQILVVVATNSIFISSFPKLFFLYSPIGSRLMIWPQELTEYFWHEFLFALSTSLVGNLDCVWLPQCLDVGLKPQSPDHMGNDLTTAPQPRPNTMIQPYLIVIMAPRTKITQNHTFSKLHFLVHFTKNIWYRIFVWSWIHRID